MTHNSPLIKENATKWPQLDVEHSTELNRTVLLLIGKEETNSKLLLFVIKIEAFMLHASIFSYDKRLVLISYPY